MSEIVADIIPGKLVRIPIVDQSFTKQGSLHIVPSSTLRNMFVGLNLSQGVEQLTDEHRKAYRYCHK